MEYFTVEYKGREIACLRFPDKGLLLKTKDICAILNIVERPYGHELSAPSLDLASASMLAYVRDSDFAEWLTETFASYNLETLVRPMSDDDWTSISNL